MMDHILSYEFRTSTPREDKKKKDTHDGNPYETLTEEDKHKLKMFKTKLYRDSKGFPLQKLEHCQSWWDVVVFRYFGELASVTFVVDRQEETLKYDTEIQRAWLKIALSDYQTEFVRVYDFFNYFGAKENKYIKELYGPESYLFANSQSLENIKTKYLNTYDLVMPNNPLI